MKKYFLFALLSLFFYRLNGMNGVDSFTKNVDLCKDPTLTRKQIEFLKDFQSNGNVVLIENKPCLKLFSQRTTSARMALLFKYSNEKPKQWTRAYPSNSKGGWKGGYNKISICITKSTYNKSVHGSNYEYKTSIDELKKKIKELFPDKNSNVRKALDTDILTLETFRTSIIKKFLKQFDDHLDTLKNENLTKNQQTESWEFCFNTRDGYDFTNGNIYWNTKKNTNNLPDQITQLEWKGKFDKKKKGVSRVHFFCGVFPVYLFISCAMIICNILKYQKMNFQNIIEFIFWH